MKEYWLIWSIQRHAWWKARRQGYTHNQSKAGRYSFDQAKKIVYEANLWRITDPPNEAMILDGQPKKQA